MVLTISGSAILLLFSAFFSGAEAALFSLPVWRSADLPEVKKLLAHPQRLLAVLLFGNLLVNISLVALFTLFLLQVSYQIHIPRAVILGVGGVLITLAILFLGEVMPKMLARRNPERYSRLVAPVIRGLQPVLAPVGMVLEKLGGIFSFLPNESLVLSDDELRAVIEEGKRRGVLFVGEEEIMRNLIEMDHRTVSEVMTPRSDIVAVAVGSRVAEALETCRHSGFSRLPVYAGSLENITGVVYAKDLLTAPDPNLPVSTVVRPPYFIPEVKRLSAVLDELRRRNSHIAIVVDEFGQVAGLVTLEDILETILGEIADEFDTVEEVPYQKIGEAEFLVDGEIDIATLNQLFDNAFSGVNHERLSAFIQDRLGRLAQIGDTITFQNLQLTVTDLSERKLSRVLIKRFS